jgi:hypothetical protein
LDIPAEVEAISRCAAHSAQIIANVRFASTTIWEFIGYGDGVSTQKGGMPSPRAVQNLKEQRILIGNELKVNWTCTAMDGGTNWANSFSSLSANPGNREVPPVR